MSVSVVLSLLWDSVKRQCRKHWRVGAGAVLVAVCLRQLGRYRVYLLVSRKIRQKQRQCRAAFQKIENNLKMTVMDKEDCARILSLTAPELQQELKDGKIKAIQVLHAYQGNALEVTKRLNCVTEPLLDAEALEVTKRLNCVTEPLLDAEAVAGDLDAISGEKGPLHGIPISLKESFYLAGLESTGGFGQYVGDTQSEDAVIVKVIRKQGAVPFVRTNIPQTMMTYECNNPLFGRTNNPYDVTRTPGGSTGGEGAIIGAGASIIGFGTDIGGSIRAPAHFSGCYGLKTTLERLSRKGALSFSKGQTQVSGTVGPMSRDLDGLVLAMKAVLCDYHFQLDPSIPPIHFRQEIYESSRPLRVGFYLNNGFIDSVPACHRGVMLAKKALEAQGHTVVPFQPPRMKYVIPHLYLQTVTADRGRVYISRMERDIADPDAKALVKFQTVSRWLLWLLSWPLQKASRDENFGELIRCRRGITSVSDWWKHCLDLQSYKTEFLEAWRASDLDLVISPVMAYAAVPHGDIADIIMGGSYCMLYNVVNYPAGSMPVTKVTNNDVDNMGSYPKVTWMQKAIHKATKGSEGLPINVQVAGLPFQEELVLRGMKEIQRGLAADTA